MNDTKSARRYAKALVETAADPRAVRDELVKVAEALQANPSLLAALSNPGVPAANKQAIFSAVFHGLSMPLPRLFEMLIDTSRVELVRQIADRYAVEWNSRNNVHVAHVFSAFALDSDEVVRVRKAIEKAVSGTVDMKTTIDATLVGGLKVEVDGHMFDGSVKARLKALRQHLL